MVQNALYQVTTGNLNKSVKRNFKRFPPDFIFKLNEKEYQSLIFQNGISKRGGTRKPPFAFTEQGVAMLSGVLSSDTAIEVNLRIIRIFTRLWEMLLSHTDLLLKLEQLEKQVVQNSDDIRMIFSALKQLFQVPRTRGSGSVSGEKKKQISDAPAFLIKSFNVSEIWSQSSGHWLNLHRRPLPHHYPG